MKKQVKIFPNDRGGMTILVDGVDVSGFVAKSGVAVEIRDGLAYVWLPVVPAVFFAEAPEAVINALSAAPGLAVMPDDLRRWIDLLDGALYADRPADDAEKVLAEMKSVLEVAGGGGR